jgi:hypothetical protein
MDDRNKNASELCDTIELVLIHGMKVKKDDDYNNGGGGVRIPLWELFEHFEEAKSNICIPLRNTCAIVSCAMTLKTSWGKARAFVRQMLNSQTFEPILQYLSSPATIQSSKPMQLLFHEEALLRSRDDFETVSEKL